MTKKPTNLKISKDKSHRLRIMKFLNSNNLTMNNLQRIIIPKIKNKVKLYRSFYEITMIKSDNRFKNRYIGSKILFLSKSIQNRRNRIVQPNSIYRNILNIQEDWIRKITQKRIQRQRAVAKMSILMNQSKITKSILRSKIGKLLRI